MQLWKREAIGRDGQRYLSRLRIVSCRLGGVYLHRFHAADEPVLHDHPWPFLTVILRGGYREHVPGGSRWRRAGSVLWRPARWRHWIEIDPARPAVTLVVRGVRVRRWGFWRPEGWEEAG